MTDEEQMDDYIERALQLLTERTKKPCVDFRLTDSEPDIFSGKIGGTPYLPHDAYPPKNKDGKEMHLLFQLEYEHRCGKNWREGAKVILGDCGVINFFITRKDLKALDFSRVRYRFSCS